MRINRIVLELVEQQVIVRATFSTDYVLAVFDGEYKYTSDTSWATAVIGGIWLNLENFPGSNRGWRAVITHRFPAFVQVDPLDLEPILEQYREKVQRWVNLHNRTLELWLERDDLFDEEFLDSVLESYAKLCNLILALYKTEVDNEEDI